MTVLPPNSPWLDLAPLWGKYKHWLNWTNGETYDFVEIYYNESGGSWASLRVLTGNVNVSLEESTANITTGYKVRGNTMEGGWSDFCDPVYLTHWDDTATDTLTVSDVATGLRIILDTATETLTVSDETISGFVYVDTVTGTVTVSDGVASSATIRTDWGYFLGTDDGKVYEYSPDYYADVSAGITSSWDSKVIRSQDVFGPQYVDYWMTIKKVRIIYVDHAASTEMIAAVTTDGGVTWETQSKQNGTGSLTTKSAYYYFLKFGQYFKVRAEFPSSNKHFQLIGIEAFFELRGEAHPMT
jgi:Neuraminidase (sialidase)